MSNLAARWTCSPYSVAAADRIGRELGLSPTVAQVLSRRGHDTVDRARRFLAAEERHDPNLMRDMGAACDLVLDHVRRGSRIVVHGDYDVDGVCSTAIVVEALRALGADPSWHLPARADGYGLSKTTVDRLAAECTGLLVTVDCGITSVAEVDAARAHGIDVVVTDHHRPGERLPSCPVLHPALDPYPFEGLCATGVAHKLSAALRGRAGLDPDQAERELDLVALATVCDLVPLRDENRRLVRDGLRALAGTSRPGVRALMRVAALDPGSLDERAVGFRLGPRLNAAGRLRTAEAALELLLTQDDERAREVADELDLMNRERRDVETRILFEAERARSEQADAPAYVLAGEGWHPGVVGIVASRMTERHHRPCFVVSLDADGGGRGSGRSIAAFDLHAALSACAGHLRRFGGHRAAAGFEIDAERVEAFRSDLVRHAAAVLAPEDLRPVQEIDAVVPGTALGLRLAEEIRCLAPFGAGNPEPTMLVPAARAADVRPMGEEGQHARFRLTSAGSRAEAVAFRVAPASLARDGAEPFDAAVRLELNDWNGRVEARVSLAAVCPAESGVCVVAEGEDEPFWEAFSRELEADPEDLAPTPLVSLGGQGGGRAIRDRRGEGIAGLTGELLSSGESVLLVCADVPRRREALEGVVAGLCRPPAAGESRAADCDDAAVVRELPIASWDGLARSPELAAPYRHLVAIDPPQERAALRLAVGAPAPSGEGFCHLAWGPSEVNFAREVARAALDLRGALTEVYRELREASGASGDELRRVLAGGGRFPRSGGVCARLVRVMGELGVVEFNPADGARPEAACRVLAAPRTALERSAAHRAYQGRLEQVERYLAEEGARWPSRATAADRDRANAAAGS